MSIVVTEKMDHVAARKSFSVQGGSPSDVGKVYITHSAVACSKKECQFEYTDQCASDT